MNHFKALRSALLLPAALLMAACGEDEPTPIAPGEPNIVDVAVADGSFKTLVDALRAADLVSTLQSEGPFTVFAPTDEAFEALPEGMLEILLDDVDLLTRVLTYHVVEGTYLAADVASLPSAPTVNGKSVSIAASGSGVMVDEANVIQADLEATNGVVHVIDAVLLPELVFDIVEQANAAGFGTLVAALEATDLTDVLKGDGPFTVFAPTEEAFGDLGFTLEALLADSDLLADILTYHVVPGAVPAADVVSLTSATTVNGADVTISVDNGVVSIDDATVTATDIETVNGIIHVIDRVLLPEELPTIVEIATGSDDFSTLVAALSAADLVSTLEGPGPFTVFAPTNAAFAALPDGVVDALLADTELLTRVLTYHVAGDLVTSSEVVGLTEAPTLNGKAIDVSIVDGAVKLDDATVTGTDIVASNGIVHVIDDVLLPEVVFDIVQAAQDAGTFNTLLAAVEAAGLTGTLKSDGPWTVLAPTDAAFAALPDGTVDALLADIPALTDVLLYHVLDAEATSDLVVTLSSATMVNGDDVAISVTDGAVRINDANVVVVDIETTNGVIHVLDAVLLPPTP